MSLRIRQIVFATHDLAGTVAQFEQALGLEVAYRDPQVAEFGVENALLPVGDQFLEVLAPTRAGTAAGRHLDRHGDSAYMLILQTDDLARDRARLAQLGVRIVWQSSYNDISAVHIHPKDIGAAIVSIDQPIPPASWRWAGPDWKRHVTRRGAFEILEATIGAGDPSTMAQRWSEVLGIGPPSASADGQRIAIERGALNFARGRDSGDGITAYKIRTNASRADVSICGTRFEVTNDE